MRELLLLESRRRRRDEFDGDDETEDDERGITKDASISTTRLGCSSVTGDSASVLAEVKDVCEGSGVSIGRAAGRTPSVDGSAIASAASEESMYIVSARGARATNALLS